MTTKADLVHEPQCRHTNPRDRIVCAWSRNLYWRSEWARFDHFRVEVPFTPFTPVALHRLDSRAGR